MPYPISHAQLQQQLLFLAFQKATENTLLISIVAAFLEIRILNTDITDLRENVMQYNTWKMLPETHICVCCNYKIQVPLIKAHIRSFSYHRNLSLKLLHFSTIITSFVYTNHASTASRTKQN